MRNHLVLSFCALIGLATLFHCSSSSEIDHAPPPSPIETQFSFAKFDPTTGNPGDLPLPNDLLRNPVTGQNSVPLAGEPFDSLNAISGFSTTANLVIPFEGEIDPGSVNAGSLIVIDTVSQAPVGVTFQVVTDPATGNSTVIGTPVTPLKPGRTHIAIVTQGVQGLPSNLPVESGTITTITKNPNSILNPDGSSNVASLDNPTAQALEPLRAAYQPIWQTAEAVTGAHRNFIPMAFAFTTQQLHNTLGALHDRATQENPVPTIQVPLPTPEAVDAFFNSQGLGIVPHDAIGAMYIGTFNAPHYLNHPLLGPFQGSGENVVEASREDIQFMVTLPANAQGPVPTIIFQHGITRQKEDMFALTNAAAQLGFAVIGIDMVLHGTRTKDLINNQTGAFEPDGEPDPSGSNFINLINLRVSRDNLRQSVADLYLLTRMITSGATDFNGDTVPDLAPVAISFIGQSLGAIVGTTFVSTEPAVALANLNVPGGRITSLLLNSPSFAPSILAGLAAQGLTPGTPEFVQFFLIAQTVIDDGDPINYAPYTFSGTLSGGIANNIQLQEMLGDTVVPNSATEDLARAMGITQVDATNVIEPLPQAVAPHPGSGMFQFEGGVHGFLLDPVDLHLTVAGQVQAFSYIGSALLTGQAVVINPFQSDNKQLDLDAVSRQLPHADLHPFVVAIQK